MTITDTGFVPGQTRGIDSDIATETAPGSGPNRKLLLLVGGALLLALGLVAAFLFFTSGGSSDADTGVVPSAARPANGAASGTGTDVAPSAVAPAAPAAPVVRKHDFRDPFKALIADATAVSGTSSDPAAVAAGTSSTTSSTGSTTTAPTGTTSGATGTTATTTTTTVPVTSPSHRLQVVAVSANNTAITVKIDGKSYPGLKAGEVFAKYFKVIGIGGQVNVIQYGDVKFSIGGTKAVTVAN